MVFHDDREEIMNVVKQAVSGAVEAAISQHELDCPIKSKVIPRQDRMYTDLYNGDDGKTGVIPEIRAFLTVTADDRRRRQQRWVVYAVAAVLFGVIFYQPIEDGWKNIHSLSRLADKSDDIIKLSEEWQVLYTNGVPTPKVTSRQ